MITKRAIFDENYIIIAVKDININELVEGDYPQGSIGDVKVMDGETIPEIGMKYNIDTNTFE
jgi:hypothetical protein